MLIAILLTSSILLIGLDQLTKWWAIQQLHNANQVVSVIDGIFEFRYTENPGVAFSMLEGQRWLFIPLTLVIGVAILVMMFKSPLRRYKLFDLVCVLIFSGAIGNLIDRIAYGYVIDFLYFRLIDFPIFNVADCYVVIGAILMFWFVLFTWKEDADIPLRTMLFGIQKDKKG